MIYVQKGFFYMRERYFRFENSEIEFSKFFEVSGFFVRGAPSFQ